MLDLQWLVANVRSVRNAFGLNELAANLSEFVREAPYALPLELLEAVPVTSDSSFDVHLLRLEAFARRIPGAPRWRSVLVSETPLTTSHTMLRVERSVLKPPRDYVADFEALLAHGYPWINLHVGGLLGHALLVEVEHAALGQRGARSSVNLSGPANLVLNSMNWNLSERLTVVD